MREGTVRWEVRTEKRRVQLLSVVSRSGPIVSGVRLYELPSKLGEFQLPLSLIRSMTDPLMYGRSLPASALEDDDEAEEDDGENDDEKTGTRYNYAWFHVVFVLGTMYVAMLLTNWYILPSSSSFLVLTSQSCRNVITSVPFPSFSDLPGSIPEIPVPGAPILIGSSHVAMWMRIVSSWVCLVLYAWSLLAPVVLPDRFGI